ncbi:DUF1960-domain-containing protein [Tilletiaria anomala UBC 951]|uniref:DUF1960-domain-containing protein n=1 Tax=Tilletiaria anomala (strain ATCC 24038 / CBS 436.72 / UBC 951) TaxID=1037660 RepID=A0A066VKS7_TILAU|nr:DUF1960-domain-containing protein [Tilletiaria anomala UBC 951]KDN40888.1 DUF1960-domain-containing protein [Tilletiaria anomala UBC 951]
MKDFKKVVYKYDSQSLDEFQVIVNGDEYEKWIKGDKTIPLTDVVDSFDVFITGQGKEGLMGRASKQQLENVFGTSKSTDVILQILEKGQLIASSVKDRFSTTNDSKANHNIRSAGSMSGGGHGGR